MAKRRTREARLKIAKAPMLRRSPQRRFDVTRAEYNHIIDVLNERGDIINDLRRELEVQFKRIAQMQSELDEVRRAWVKAQRAGTDG